MEDEKLISHIHDIINKAVSCQSYLHLLQRKELGEKESEYVDKAYKSVMETLDAIKKLRNDIQ